MARTRTGLPELTVADLCREAAAFAEAESTYPEPSLYGATDGKRIGTYLEHKFRAYLAASYTLAPSNSAADISFPGIGVEFKAADVAQPRSLCPFVSARQKIFGLGYSLLVIFYDKHDDHATATAHLTVRSAIYIDGSVTADYMMTKLIRGHLSNGCGAEELTALMCDLSLPVDDIGAAAIAEELLAKGCPQGYLTISTVREWRLGFKRVIDEAGTRPGIDKIR